MQRKPEPFETAIFLIPMALLVMAIFPWPYGYYTFLRLVVTACSILCIFAAKDEKLSEVFTIIFALLALLYNPFIPVHLSKEAWVPINIITIIIYIFSWTKYLEAIRRKPSKDDEGNTD